jgi:hypothetical protein
MFLIRRWSEDFRPEAAKFDPAKMVREVLQKPGRMRWLRKPASLQKRVAGTCGTIDRGI